MSCWTTYSARERHEPGRDCSDHLAHRELWVESHMGQRATALWLRDLGTRASVGLFASAFLTGDLQARDRCNGRLRWDSLGGARGPSSDPRCGFRVVCLPPGSAGYLQPLDRAICAVGVYLSTASHRVGSSQVNIFTARMDNFWSLIRSNSALSWLMVFIRVS